MQIEQADISSIIPYEHNPRRNADAVRNVAESLTQFGWRQPIVVDADRVVIVGHTRLLAAQSLGMDTVPVHVAENITPEQARAYRLADNKTGEAATWDNELLKLELEGLTADGVDLSLTGFNDAELAAVFTDQDVEFNAEDEWQGMPEFEVGLAKAYRTLIVHFKDQQAVDDFLERNNKEISDKTKAIWFPEIEIDKVADKVYE
jgi:hypothetical protein